MINSSDIRPTVTDSPRFGTYYRLSVPPLSGLNDRVALCHLYGEVRRILTH